MNLPWQHKAQCQVVIKLPPGPGESFDRVAECELKLSKLMKTGEVDLREVGGDIVSLYILTTDPAECVQEAIAHLSTMKIKPVAAGVRASKDDEYMPLWPEAATSQRPPI